jgi:hypothetical protein
MDGCAQCFNFAEDEEQEVNYGRASVAGAGREAFSRAAGLLLIEDYLYTIGERLEEVLKLSSSRSIK